MKRFTTISYKASKGIQISIEVAMDGSYAVAQAFVAGALTSFDVLRYAKVRMPDYMEERLNDLGVDPREYFYVPYASDGCKLMPIELFDTVLQARDFALQRAKLPS